MLKNRLIIGCTFLGFVLCLPSFAAGQETPNVASWFIHDDPSFRIKRNATLGEGEQDATAQNESNVVAKLALQGSRASSTTTHVIPWSVLNEGGKTEEATSASYKLKDAIGQPVIGTCESASYKAYIGFWAPGPLWIVGVEEMQDTRSKKLETRLFQNYPNPFNSLTAISYSIAKSADSPYGSAASLRIYNISGRLVKTFDLTNNQSPFNQVVWDGKDETGRRVAPGVYFYRLITGEYRLVKKLVILR